MTTIDLNALALRPGGSGVQTYIRELLAKLPAVWDGELTAHVQADAAGELPGQVRAIRHPVAAGARRALTSLTLRTGDSAVHHGMDVDLPLHTTSATVATVHDLSVFDMPEAYSRYRATAERVLMRRAIQRADAVLAVSQFTAERVADRFGRQATVTPLAARSGLQPPNEAERERVRAAYELPSRCVLQLATIEPRKDVDRLAAACASLDVPLVLAGAIHPASAVPARARHLGYVPDADLPGLYAAATVVAYCSRYEGFGLPAVEAMACGAALLTTAVGGLPQACGNAALVVARESTCALQRGLRQLLDDAEQRIHLRRVAPDQAARLSWRRTAQLTADVYRQLGAA